MATSSVIKAYEGDYLFKEGTPYVLTVSDRTRAGDILVEVYLILRHSSDISKFSMETWAIRADAATMQKVADADAHATVPVDFMSGEAENWVWNFLNTRSHVACEKHGAPYPPKRYELKPLSWKILIRRLRFNGLGTRILEAIQNGTQSQELMDWARGVSLDAPIVVRPVILAPLPPA